jgi:mono/diheme cytochrome c family protein
MWAGPHADVFWHRWLGVGVTVFALIVAVVATVSRRRNHGEPTGNNYDRAERWHMGVIISAILVGLVGHQGGLLVYGEDFYRKAIAKLFNIDDETSVVTPIVNPPAPKPDEKVDFAKHIKPIFEAHCISCHGPEKDKANLQLQNKTLAFSTGDMHPDEIVPGKPELSELYFRVSTDDTDDLMPPEDEGGPLPTVQIELIKRWIAEGADWPEDVTLEDKSK